MYFSSFDPFSLNRAYGEIIRGIVMGSTIVTMILFNVTRLDRFICRSDIFSQCCLFYDDNDRLTKFPEDYLPQMLSKQIIEMCYNGSNNKSLTNNADELCYNGSSNKPWKRVVYFPYHQLWQKRDYPPDQVKDNIVEKHPFTQVVEYLILLWMTQVTTCQDRMSQVNGCQDKEFSDFKKKKIFLSQIKSRPNGGNVFLEMLPFVNRSERIHESILNASIDLAADIKEIKFQPHDTKKDDVDAGMVILKGKYFDIEIRYEWQNQFSYSASLTPSGLLWPKIEGISINPGFLNSFGNDKVTNTHMRTYKIE